MALESQSVLDDESSSRHEEISTTLVGFLEAIELAKLKEAAEEANKKAKPAEPRRPAQGEPAAGAGGRERMLMVGGAVGVGVLVLAVIIVLAVKFGGGPEEKRQPVAGAKRSVTRHQVCPLMAT